MPGNKTGGGGSMEEVRARFEQWRNGRRGKGRIPEELWTVALETARREGVNRTAQELHLDGGKLKRLLVAADALADEVLHPPGFVELIAPGRAQFEECVIEFESSGGSKMRVQWKTTAPPDWASLLRAWRETQG